MGIVCACLPTLRALFLSLHASPPSLPLSRPSDGVTTDYGNGALQIGVAARSVQDQRKRDLVEELPLRRLDREASM